MWRKRKWLIVGMVAAVIILVAGIVGGVAYAQTSTTSTTTPATTTTDTGKTGILARVAEILGIDQQKLQDAFNQAEREQTDAALTARLDALVKDGKLTQAQADQYKKWWESRPDTVGQVDGKGFMGGRGGMPGCFPGKLGKAIPGATQ
jgi:uncharacterized membrane protein